MTPPAPKRISLIAPCYNEGASIEAFLVAIRRIAHALPQYQFEFLFVDDGSTDQTIPLLLSHVDYDRRIRVLSLSRNFGHQRAITAGIDWCSGDFVIVLDADLQDPPELIPQIIEKLEEGFDIVHTVRVDRGVDTLGKRMSAWIFYKVMHRWVLPDLPRNAGDYKGLNRRAVETLRLYRERVRYLRGLFATMGFRQTQIPYTRALRHSGGTKFSRRAMVRFARDAVVSNTVLPLRAGLYAGAGMLLGSPLLAAALAAYYRGVNHTEPVALMVLLLVWLCAGALLCMVGAVGEYLKVLVLEVKQRPLYVVKEAHNLEVATPGAIEPVGMLERV